MDITLIATFFVVLVSSVLSGIAGGGGGFVVGPYWLLIGMSPAQSGTIGVFIAIGIAIGSVLAFRKSQTVDLPADKALLSILLITTCIASVIGGLVVPKIDIEAFKIVLSVVTLLALPLLFIKPKTRHQMARYRKTGIVLAVLLLLAGSIIFSSAFSVLFTLVLMSFFNLPVLQTIFVRRLVGAINSVVLFAVLASQGYFIWQHAVVGLLGGIIGSHLGTAFAIKKGENFAKWALATMSLIGVALLFA